MSSYLRPRRGKKNTAETQLTSSTPLKRGEVFFEVPDTGVGTGLGKIKMGDGVTGYSALPYFLDNSGNGGHVIENPSGTDMTQRDNIQFIDAHISDDSTNDRTKIEVISEATQSDFDDLDETDATNEGLYAIDYTGDAPLLTDNMIGHDATHTVRDSINSIETMLNTYIQYIADSFVLGALSAGASGYVQKVYTPPTGYQVIGVTSQASQIGIVPFLMTNIEYANGKIYLNYYTPSAVAESNSIINVFITIVKIS